MIVLNSTIHGEVMKTKVLLLGSGDEPSVFHSRIIDTLQHSPEHLIIYINQDTVDTIKGLDYDCVILDELVDLGCIEQARGITIKSDNVNVGTIGHPDWYYDPAQLVQVDGCMGIANKNLSGKIVDTKHKKPFYQTGRW